MNIVINKIRNCSNITDAEFASRCKDFLLANGTTLQDYITFIPKGKRIDIIRCFANPQYSTPIYKLLLTLDASPACYTGLDGGGLYIALREGHTWDEALSSLTE